MRVVSFVSKHVGSFWAGWFSIRSLSAAWPARRGAIALVACTLISCSSWNCGGALQNFNIISDAQELEMGSQFSREVERDIKLYKDPETVKYIDGLGQALVKRSQRSDIPYYIKVVDTDDVNAFAIPGGYLYVNRGLISTAENESELVGVMGHEIGHVVGRHGAKQLSRQYGLEILSSLILGENPGTARQLAVQFAGIGGTLGLFHYSREAELEADRLAVHEMYDAGFDPEGMATFFEKLMALHEREPSGLEALFATHPATPERIKSVRQIIASLPKKTGLRKDSEQFQQLKKRLPALKKKEK
jgi:predicted Zn-dependent protease